MKRQEERRNTYCSIISVLARVILWMTGPLAIKLFARILFWANAVTKLALAVERLIVAVTLVSIQESQWQHSDGLWVTLFSSICLSRPRDVSVSLQLGCLCSTGITHLLFLPSQYICISLGGEDPQEKEMATHSSILAWRIPWTEEPGGLPSMGSHRVGHD